MTEPAFPSPKSRSEGVTIRDYFAAKAMQSLLVLDEDPAWMIADMSYEMADLMIKKRERDADVRQD